MAKIVRILLCVLLLLAPGSVVLAAVRSEIGTGIIGRTGRLVIPAIFRSTEDFSGGLILAKGKSVDVYFNKRGEVVWPRNYTLPQAR